MKKLFIGCGLVVLLIVGVLGWAVYQVYPEAKQWQQRWTAAFAQLDQLDQQHPFEPDAQAELDSQRFAQVLDLRANLAEYLRGTVAQLESATGENGDGDEPGVIETFKLFFRATQEPPIVFAERLAETDMGPTEFSWYTKVLWASLRRVDQGAGEPELEPLRGRYDAFEEFYSAQRKQKPSEPPLDELIGNVPQAVVAQAGQVLASDIGRVLDGLYALELDHFYMLLPIHRIEDLQVVVDPERAGDAPGR